MKDFKRYEKRIYLASPTMHGEEQAFVKEAFDTNWVSTVGANLDALEQGICNYVGCKCAVGLSAGTAALHLAVKLAGVKHGDIVLCSDMTFAATVNPVAYEGGVQVFVDSERDSWNMSPIALERAFEKYPQAKVVVVASLYGTPAKFDEILEVCNRHGAILIEDAAEALGATYKDKQSGTFGKYNAISFNGNKIITTSGGGMLLTDDEAAAKKAKFWSTQARENFPWYQHKEIGYNYRLSNILAGIGRGQLLHLNEHIRAKKTIYERYKIGFAGLPISMNPYLPESSPNFWLSCLLLDKGVKATPEDIRLELEKYNIESRPIWKPMHLQPIYKKNDFITENGEDVGADIFSRGLCLPSDNKMTCEVQDVIIKIINEIINAK